MPEICDLLVRTLRHVEVLSSEVCVYCGLLGDSDETAEFRFMHARYFNPVCVCGWFVMDFWSAFEHDPDQNSNQISWTGGKKQKYNLGEVQKSKWAFSFTLSYLLSVHTHTCFYVMMWDVCFRSSSLKLWDVKICVALTLCLILWLFLFFLTFCLWFFLFCSFFLWFFVIVLFCLASLSPPPSPPPQCMCVSIYGSSVVLRVVALAPVLSL